MQARYTINQPLQFQVVIFDLDGTLIDSAPGILYGFESVLKRAGIKPLVPISKSLIGPPLRQTLATLTGINEDAELDTLVEFFKDSYDSDGYQTTRVYDGVEELLAFLANKHIPMAIATNKRKVPTFKILEFLGWESYFLETGTLDSTNPPYPDKTVLIGTLLTKLGVATETSVYIGDTQGDGEAAEANQMPFIAVGWGYGAWRTEAMKDRWHYAGSPNSIIYRFL